MTLCEGEECEWYQENKLLRNGIEVKKGLDKSMPTKKSMVVGPEAVIFACGPLGLPPSFSLSLFRYLSDQFPIGPPAKHPARRFPLSFGLLFLALATLSFDEVG